eukprot:2165028-Amphidinium_carterae.1
MLANLNQVEERSTTAEPKVCTSDSQGPRRCMENLSHTELRLTLVHTKPARCTKIRKGSENDQQNATCKTCTPTRSWNLAVPSNFQQQDHRVGL